ncbi:MAG: ATP--guanido phosphotransferase, partial [Verrucomicrobiota bacterium]
EEQRPQFLDKIGRAYGVLRNVHVLSSNEAMNLLSLMRLAVDFSMLPEENRSIIDRLFIECQPGHIQYAANGGIKPEERDIGRANKLREQFQQLPSLNFKMVSDLD